MSDVVVVDTSLAIKWVLQEQDSQAARRLLLDWDQRGVHLLTLRLLLSEMLTPLLRHFREGLITRDEISQAIALLTRVVEIRDEDPLLAERACDLALQFNQLHAYDSMYAALAEREKCELWTADERFWNAARSHVAWVRHLSEVP